MKRVLVTGSSGYIGQHLVNLLQQKMTWVTGLDKDASGPWHLKGDEFIFQSILDGNPIDTEFDTVIHLAALVQVAGGQKAAMDYYRTNVVGTMNMLERVQYKNFIFASTCQANFSNVYGQSKSIAESIIRQYAQLNNKNYTIFRFGNVVGNGNLTNTDGLMYNLIKAKETGVFNLYGDDYNTPDGTALRDYVHVHEVCHALKLAITEPSCVPMADVQPFYEYLGRAMPVSVNECINAFKKANKCDFEVVVKPRREGDTDVTPISLVSSYMPLNIYTLEGLMTV